MTYPNPTAKAWDLFVKAYLRSINHEPWGDLEMDMMNRAEWAGRKLGAKHRQRMTKVFERIKDDITEPL